MDATRQGAEGAEKMPAVFVDIDSLNPSQRFIYNVVHKHAQMCAHANTHGEPPPPPPLNTLICGTAGSGKTYLIGALKQLLKESCLVCAPIHVGYIPLFFCNSLYSTPFYAFTTRFSALKPYP